MAKPQLEKRLSESSIPAELKKYHQWVVWRYETHDGNRTKVPYQTSGENASTTDAATWDSYQTVLEAYSAGRFDGIGFVVTPTDKFCGIDLDHCRDAETGVIEPKKLEYIKLLDSYTEVSPSNTGVRVWVKAKIPEGGANRNDPKRVEIYDRSRFFTVTGNHLEGTKATIEQRQNELNQLHAEIFPAAPRPKKGNGRRQPTDLADTELIAKATAAKNGAAFSRLWSGDTSDYGGDDSRADLALCNILAFWTGNDESRIDSLFRQSGLYRDKWEREDYRERTIRTAVNGDNEVYQPKHDSKLPKHGQPGGDTQQAGGGVYHLTDLGNAERLIDRHGKNLRYSYARKKWLLWNSKYWEWVEDGRVISLASETIRDIYRIAADETDKTKRQNLIDHAKRSESEGRLSAMVELAQSLPGVAVEIERLDSDDFLLNVANGTLDLRIPIIKPHDRNDYITSFIPIEFDPSARSELWDEFLDTIFENHPALRSFVQRALGYSCTGSQNEQACFFPYSLGGSGKSTLLNAVYDCLGADYATEVDPQVFMAKPHEQGGPNEGVAQLYRKRIAISTEIEDGQRLSVSLVKRMTGGEKLRHEKKYEHGFEFTPTHKLWLSGNHKPLITDTTQSIWRRVKLINFPVTIPEDKRDKNLRDKLRRPENQKAKLAWLVNGAASWFKSGLGEPPEVTEATKAYRQDQDIVGSFVGECCIMDQLAAVLQGDLYKAFSQWCVDTGNTILTKTKLRERIIERGEIIPAKGHGNAASWKGIKLSDYGVTLVTLVNEKYQNSLAKGITRKVPPKLITNDNQNNPIPGRNNPSDAISGELPDCPQCHQAQGDWILKPEEGPEVWICRQCGYELAGKGQ